MTKDAKSLTKEICQQRAQEALFFAHHADTQAARIMLEHIAGTWGRVSERVSITNNQDEAC